MDIYGKPPITTRISTLTRMDGPFDPGVFYQWVETLGFSFEAKETVFFISKRSFWVGL